LVEKVTRLVLCTGKIYYDLVSHPNRAENAGVAVGRIELLYPFPEAQVLELFARGEAGFGHREPGRPSVDGVGLPAGQTRLDQLGDLPADRGRVGLLELGQVGDPHGPGHVQRKQQHQRGELRTEISGVEHALGTLPQPDESNDFVGQALGAVLNVRFAHFIMPFLGAAVGGGLIVVAYKYLLDETNSRRLPGP